LLNIAICDDDENICMQLEEILCEMEGTLDRSMEIRIFPVCELLDEAIVAGEYFDIIFLDIEFKDLNGIEMGRRIRDEMNNETSRIVYISGRESYAMELFEVRPFDFIIKPIDHVRVEKIVHKIMDLCSEDKDLFEYSYDRTIKKIPVREIIYFESTGKRINIWTVKKEIRFYGQLSEVQKQLSKHSFLMIHKSFYSNIDHVIEYDYEFVRMSNKKILPISQRRRKDIREKLLKQRSRRSSR
jgi:DNA-binding LytR/AlgR family response regulator